MPTDLTPHDLNYCNACGKHKPADEFYRRKGGALYKQCKRCWSDAAKERRRLYPERTHANRRRSALVEREARRIRARRRRSSGYKQPPPDPEKRRAQSALQYAVRKGEIKRPETCSQCHKKAKVQGHHEDYSRPFDVEWLCPSCHGLRHAETRYGYRYDVDGTVAPE